jgi:hypothetical protein
VHSAKVRRVREALTNAREAVELHQRLLMLDRDVHLLNAASSLDTLAEILATMGHRVEAVTAASEAVELFQELRTLMARALVPNSADPTGSTITIEELAGRLTEAAGRLSRLLRIRA